jgi:hypothetical protein
MGFGYNIEAYSPRVRGWGSRLRRERPRDSQPRRFEGRSGRS